MTNFTQRSCLMLLLLLAACPAPPANDRTAADEGEEDPGGADAAICRGGPFVAEGRLEVQGRGPGDAERIGALRWQPHDACERVVIDLLTGEGTPATRPGGITAELLRDLGVVRISLHDVEGVETSATEGMFDGRLARAAYTVRPPEGPSTWVDIHLAGPAEAHLAILEAPARIVLDLRAGGGPIPGPAAAGGRVVVLNPRAGATTYPITVNGYARTFEANVIARLEQNGEELFLDFTTATAYIGAWGYFSITIPAGPRGPVMLHVGEFSAKDGTWEGEAVALEMR